MHKQVENTVAGAGEPTIPGWWRKLVQAHGHRELIRKDGRATTFEEMDRRSAAIARGLLAQGAGKGARIGLLMANGPDWIACWLAIQRIGGIVVAISTFFSSRELGHALRHADVAILLMQDTYLSHDYRAKLEEALPSLAERDGAAALVIPECPYLRQVWASREGRKWVRGALAELENLGGKSNIYSLEILAEVEASVSSADLAIVIYTSGSTAEPKGVVHTQRAAVSKATFLAAVNTIVPFRNDANSRPLINAPFFWVGGLTAMSAGMTLGSTLVCQDTRSPSDILATIRAEKITHITGWENALRALAAAPEFRPGDLDGLSPHNIMQRSFFNTDPSISSSHYPNALGMTETFGPHSGEPDGQLLPPEVAGAFGHALPGMEYKIIDPETGAQLAVGEAGELCVRGGWLMDGFYKRDRRDVFEPDGFYRTGDHCMVDAQGYLHFRGRLGGMIKTSAANVSPEEVENVLKSLDGVVEAAVFGVPHAKLGEMVIAVVALRGGSPLTEQALKAAVRAELSSFKVPKRILFMELAEFPKTPSNKIRKPALASMVADRLLESEHSAAEA